jgi:hypothetical protein
LITPLEIFASVASVTHGSDIVLEKNNFAKAEYVFTVPKNLQGPVQLEVAGFNAPPVGSPPRVMGP